MHRFILSLIVLFTASIANSHSAVQTDWSGGPDVEGPVSDWGNTFYSETDCDVFTSPGSLSLSIEDAEHLLEDNQNVLDLHIADIDGDGDNDVIGSGWKLCWWENTFGTAGTWVKHVVQDPLYPSPSVYCGDMDMDGDIDIVTGESRYVNWWENQDGTGLSWTAHLVASGMSHTVDIQVVDLDGDGDMDIVTVEDEAFFQSIKVWLNKDGTGTSWEQVSLPDNLDISWSLHCSDIDSDGDLDIVSGDLYDGFVYWWENDSSGRVWMRYAVNEDQLSGVTAVFSGDIDGDGYTDIAASGYGALMWWKNLTGHGTTWLERFISFQDTVKRLHGNDYDNDGDTDLMVVITDEGLDRISWFERTAYSFTEHVLDNWYYHANALFAGDISGDGKADVLTSHSTGYNDINWWDLRVFDGGYLKSSILYTGCDPVWSTLECTAVAGDPINMYFLIRASDDPDIFGTLWSDPLYPPCSIAGVIPDSCSYVQYMVCLETENPLLSPVLEDVTISWSSVGIEETTEPLPPDIMLLPFSPNPSNGAATIIFNLPEPAFVSVSVFDLTGRKVFMSSSMEYSPGTHSIPINEFPPGIYACRMISGDFIETQRFVVIE